MLALLLQRVSFGVFGFASSMGEAAKPFLFQGVKVSKLGQVSNEMLAFRLQHVSVRVSAFSLASPCLWGKLQKHVVLEGVEISKLEDVSHEIIFLRLLQCLVLFLRFS